ncbi:hypothetical protein NX059_007688 [Plenodomus lindquistii]|nr:hypothetical protein NX059_007688 [Plenodomus lindquistii]
MGLHVLSQLSRPSTADPSHEYRLRISTPTTSSPSFCSHTQNGSRYVSFCEASHTSFYVRTFSLYNHNNDNQSGEYNAQFGQASSQSGKPSSRFDQYDLQILPLRPFAKVNEPSVWQEEANFEQNFETREEAVAPPPAGIDSQAEARAPSELPVPPEWVDMCRDHMSHKITLEYKEAHQNSTMSKAEREVRRDATGNPAINSHTPVAEVWGKWKQGQYKIEDLWDEIDEETAPRPNFNTPNTFANIPENALEGIEFDQCMDQAY